METIEIAKICDELQGRINRDDVPRELIEATHAAIRRLEQERMTEGSTHDAYYLLNEKYRDHHDDKRKGQGKGIDSLKLETVKRERLGRIYERTIIHPAHDTSNRRKRDIEQAEARKKSKTDDTQDEPVAPVTLREAPPREEETKGHRKKRKKAQKKAMAGPGQGAASSTDTPVAAAIEDAEESESPIDEYAGQDLAEPTNLVDKMKLGDRTRRLFGADPNAAGTHQELHIRERMMIKNVLNKLKTTSEERIVMARNSFRAIQEIIDTGSSVQYDLDMQLQLTEELASADATLSQVNALVEQFGLKTVIHYEDAVVRDILAFEQPEKRVPKPPVNRRLTNREAIKELQLMESKIAYDESVQIRWENGNPVATTDATAQNEHNSAIQRKAIRSHIKTLQARDRAVVTQAEGTVETADRTEQEEALEAVIEGRKRTGGPRSEPAPALRRRKENEEERSRIIDNIIDNIIDRETNITDSQVQRVHGIAIALDDEYSDIAGWMAIELSKLSDERLLEVMADTKQLSEVAARSRTKKIVDLAEQQSRQEKQEAERGTHAHARVAHTGAASSSGPDLSPYGGEVEIRLVGWDVPSSRPEQESERAGNVQTQEGLPLPAPKFRPARRTGNRPQPYDTSRTWRPEGYGQWTPVDNRQDREDNVPPPPRRDEDQPWRLARSYGSATDDARQGQPAVEFTERPGRGSSATREASHWRPRFTSIADAPRRTFSCKRCGREGHEEQDCRNPPYCTICSKIGHRTDEHGAERCRKCGYKHLGGVEECRKCAYCKEWAHWGRCRNN